MYLYINHICYQFYQIQDSSIHLNDSNILNTTSPTKQSQQKSQPNHRLQNQRLTHAIKIRKNPDHKSHQTHLQCPSGEFDADRRLRLQTELVPRKPRQDVRFSDS